ncbi:MAG: DUF2244 domain-containing protein [Burkholderiales bacterium]|nr:DUF2244 domain-containing protein [Anaerolineae bacterium]
MECTFRQETGYSCIARRHNSLSSTNRLFAFGFIAVISMVIALAFAWLGAWLILPFAGIELLVIFFVARHIERHAQDYERLTIVGEIVAMEVVDAGHVERREFNRRWAQVICERDGSRLALRSHGHEVVFGRHLTGDERLAMARTLRQQLRT